MSIGASNEGVGRCGYINGIGGTPNFEVTGEVRSAGVDVDINTVVVSGEEDFVTINLNLVITVVIFTAANINFKAVVIFDGGTTSSFNAEDVCT